MHSSDLARGVEALSVETSVLHHCNELEVEREQLEEDLWNDTYRPPPDLPHENMLEWLERRDADFASRERAEWRTVAIRLDGELTEFMLLGSGENWVAFKTMDGIMLKLHARSFPLESVELVTLSDVERYIKGDKRFHERVRRKRRGLT